MFTFFKNKIMFFLIVSLFSFSFFNFVSANDPSNSSDNLSNSFGSKKIMQPASKMGFNTSGGAQIEDVVGVVISSILGFLGVIFGILIIYGGFLWMMAGGNDQEVDKAKKIIKNAAIGLVVVLLSYGLSWLVLSIFVSAGPDVPN